MSIPVVDAPTVPPVEKPNDKEFNFRQQQASYERKLAEERAERERLVRELEELKRMQPAVEEEDSEPYLDHKRFRKEQAKFGQQMKQETRADIHHAVQEALQNERKKAFLDANPDFYDTLQKHADNFQQKAPQLAETILQMPDTFERQKLVYHNIKSMQLDRPPVKEPSIQEKIDANKKTPYYQPSSVGNPPYAAAGDFSEAGMKTAYAKIKELQKRLSF